MRQTAQADTHQVLHAEVVDSSLNVYARTTARKPFTQLPTRPSFSGFKPSFATPSPSVCSANEPDAFHHGMDRLFNFIAPCTLQAAAAACN